MSASSSSTVAWSPFSDAASNDCGVSERDVPSSQETLPSVSAVESDECCEPVFKRRRLRRKGVLRLPPAPEADTGPKSHPPGPEARGSAEMPMAAWGRIARECGPLPDHEKIQLLDKKKRYDWFRGRVRVFLWRVLKAKLPLPEPLASAGLPNGSWNELRIAFSYLAVECKHSAEDLYLNAVGLGQTAVGRLLRPEGRAGLDCNRRKMFFTYISAAWILRSEQIRSAANPDAVAKVVVQMPVCCEIWQAFLRHVRCLCSALGAAHWAACCEVCPDTWRKSGLCQLHFHVCLLRGRINGNFRTPMAAEIVFQGVRPHNKAPERFEGRSRNGSGEWVPYFYCCVNKVGQLWSESDKRPFLDFPVHALWLMNLAQSEKLAVADAKALLKRVGMGATRYLQDLDHMETVRRRALLQTYRLSVMAALKSAECGWEIPPEVRGWQVQYTTLLPRYKFLVLDGPSGTGKSTFARTLGPRDLRVCELNCAGSTLPSLRDFDWFQDGLILFDEIEPGVVAANRKLFQASNVTVQLGCSPTGMHEYEVFVHRTRMVCTSNHWDALLQQLSLEDRLWIQSNQTYVAVPKPLWAVNTC